MTDTACMFNKSYSMSENISYTPSLFFFLSRRMKILLAYSIRNRFFFVSFPARDMCIAIN